MKKKTIGILGGMGAFASAYLYKKILQLSHEKYGAVQDWEYPHIIINSLSLIGSSERGMEKNDTIRSQLIQGVLEIHKVVDILGIACNSVHIFIDDLRNVTHIPIINMVEKTANETKGEKRILLLASQTSYHHDIYKQYLPKTLVYPIQKERNIIESLILSVMKGEEPDRDSVVHTVNTIVRSNRADAIILGCTELSPIIDQDNFEIPIYAATDILATTLLNVAMNSYW